MLSLILKGGGAGTFCSGIHFFSFLKKSGAEGDRTPDLMLAKHALSQLSYSPKNFAEQNFWS